MKSQAWIHFEEATFRRTWDAAANQLNGLAMTEMLPALQELPGQLRSDVVQQSRRILDLRGWTPSAQRILWAGELVEMGTLPTWTPIGLPAPQQTDARNFLAGPIGRILSLRRLVRSGRIVFEQTSDNRFVNTLTDGGWDFIHHRLSSGVLDLMLTLGAAAPTRILSLLRPGQGPHGVLDRGFTVTRAIDVSFFQGTPVTLSPPAGAIRVVTAILRSLPAGTYKIGFPRPIGGPTGFDPAADVFFPVPDLATAKKCFDGTIALPLSAMLQPAQNAVRAAIPAGVRFDALFPDGLNHMHIEMRSDTSLLPA